MGWFNHQLTIRSLGDHKNPGQWITMDHYFRLEDVGEPQSTESVSLGWKLNPQQIPMFFCWYKANHENQKETAHKKSINLFGSLIMVYYSNQ